MQGHFQRKAAAYYTRATQGKKRSIRFHNGMSLDELAGQMALETKIDGSSLSRILRGERLPTADQLRIFCAVLDMSEEQEDGLRAAAVKDYGDRIGYDLDVAADPRVVNLLVRNIEQVRSALDSEEFDRALEMLRDVRTAQTELTGDDVPPPPMLRVVTLVEAERSLLMDLLAYRASMPGAQIEIIGIAEAYRLVDLLHTLDLPEEVGSVGRRYFQDGETVEEIAAAFDLSPATVQAVIALLKKRLLQHLTGAADGT